MKRILVCGGGGFLGYHLSKKLKEDSDSYVVVADLLEKNSLAEQTSFCDYYLSLDLMRDRSWFELETLGPFDEVYFLAAECGNLEFVTNTPHQADIYLNNLSVCINLIKFAIRWRSKVFYTSSSDVYSETDQPLSEDSLCAPTTNFGWCCLAIEKMLLAASEEYKLKVCIGRLFNLYGEVVPFLSKNVGVVSRFLGKAINNNKIPIWGSGEQVRAFLHVDDCVSAIYKLMETETYDIVNIGSTSSISINELAQKFITVNNLNLDITKLDKLEGPRVKVCDNSKLKNLVLWDEKISLDKGLESIYSWAKDAVEA